MSSRPFIPEGTFSNSNIPERAGFDFPVDFVDEHLPSVIW
jgi:hypothetical protein